MSEAKHNSDESLLAVIECVLNGQASDAQHQELEERLLHDEQAMDVYLNYANLHGSLNHWFLTDDASSELDVAGFASSLSREQLAMAAGSRSRWGWIAGCLAIGLIIAVGSWQLPLIRALLQSPGAAGPAIVQLDGEVRLVSAGGEETMLASGRTLQLGQSIVTDEDNDRVVLQYDDGTQIVLLASSRRTINR